MNTARVDLKLEALTIPVSDVDKSKRFYQDLGWRLDADFGTDDGSFRIVQFTPPGSPASIQFGTKVNSQTPGTAEGIYLVVSDVEAAHDALVALGAEVSDVFHPGAPGAQFGYVGAEGQLAGPADARASYGSFATFRDPDGNRYLLQEVTSRFAGRVEETATEYVSVTDLTGALVRASLAHGEHEARNGGQYDEKWPEWYARYMVAEAHGEQLPE
ncbi:VOC family protein [Nocardia sp. CA-151230]|uniref:VOC family protein n=1 Tax=Nocardia sp. CA-151230 TaxID=3239982 RepID=UPI003D9097A9